MALRTVGKHHTVRSFFQWWINGLQPCPYGRDLYRLVRPGNFCNTPAFFCFPPMRFSFVSSSSTRIIPIFVPINQLFDSETTQLKTKSMAIKANTSYLQGILSCPSVAGSFIVHFFRSFPAYLSIFKTNNLHIRCQLLPPPLCSGKWLQSSRLQKVVLYIFSRCTTHSLCPYAARAVFIPQNPSFSAITFSGHKQT